MKNGTQDEEITWRFSFGLEAGGGRPVSRACAEQLLDHIIA
jgi:hypothetical protein